MKRALLVIGLGLMCLAANCLTWECTDGVCYCIHDPGHISCTDAADCADRCPSLEDIGG